MRNLTESLATSCSRAKRHESLLYVALATGLLLGCQPRSPADEDACTTDAQCGGGLVCCHSSEEGLSASSAKHQDRGFCVKAAVCDNVAAPSQTPLPRE
jgi:hypothetical protein